VAWDGVVRLRRSTSGELAEAHGGVLRGSTAQEVGRFSPVDTAGEGDLAPLLARRFIAKAVAAHARGAMILLEATLADDPRVALLGGWVHPHAAWAMACLLDERATVAELPAQVGRGATIGPHVTLAERVVLGDRVSIGASSVIGGVGFGWATGPNGTVKRMPHLAGVVIEDDVSIGPLCTIDAGVLSPTILRRGARLDAHVHVGHNCEIGEGTFVAAQSGFAGSAKIGRGVLVGGQVGVGDHVTIGDGARIAGKSGVIGDVPAGATVAGYPAVPRGRWLRGLAGMYRALGRARHD
jgi:UDP-3-O-[3-hydroxymyristoyl] glucosamine N-acyltransferase